MVCVFDQFGLRTYCKEDCKVDGKVFTYDERDKKSKLFPLTLFRKTQEKLDTQGIIASLSLTSCADVERTFPVTIPPVMNMPTFVSDGAELPAMLLAHTYIKEGLSEVDRLHAKCGDVGIKYLKRAFPDLKVPKKSRCEHCIQGKIHKFGHSACAPDRRTLYPPGACIAADHSGPYAVSTGGARYSELFICETSGYLWGFRQRKKTEHINALPQVLADSQALSGRVW